MDNEQKDPDETTETEAERIERRDGCILRLLFFATFLGALTIALSLKGCKSCTRDSYDDRWDHVQKQVDKDPYYRQW